MVHCCPGQRGQVPSSPQTCHLPASSGPLGSPAISSQLRKRPWKSCKGTVTEKDHTKVSCLQFRSYFRSTSYKRTFVRHVYQWNCMFLWILAPCSELWSSKEKHPTSLTDDLQNWHSITSLFVLFSLHFHYSLKDILWINCENLMIFPPRQHIHLKERNS